MSESRDHSEQAEQRADQVPPGEDGRLPYEPPRLTKKRSVARATLQTAMGPSMTGLTMMG